MWIWRKAIFYEKDVDWYVCPPWFSNPITFVGFPFANSTSNTIFPIHLFFLSSTASVLYGNGNKFGDEKEGFFLGNVIATYLHGPLLSKNPEVSDYIIKYCLNRKYNKDPELTNINQLDDSFENKCREQLIKEFLGKDLTK